MNDILFIITIITYVHSFKEALVKARNVRMIDTPAGYKSMMEVVQEGKH